MKRESSQYVKISSPMVNVTNYPVESNLATSKILGKICDCCHLDLAPPMLHQACRFATNFFKKSLKLLTIKSLTIINIIFLK